MYNIENIFSKGYADTYSLKIFLQEIVEEVQNLEKEITNKITNKTKRMYFSTNDVGSKFITNNNLKESVSEIIVLNEKNINSITLTDEDFLKNVKNIKCNIETFLVESDIIKNRIKEAIQINSSLIRRVNENKVCIPYSIISKYISNSNFFVLNFSYETTTEETNIDDEEIDNFEKIVFENNL